MQDLFDRVPEFDRFVDIVITPAGQAQLAIVAAAIYCGLWIARKVFQRFFSSHPERYDQLLPYALFRMVLPLSAAAFTGLAFLIARYAIDQPHSLLVVASITLFWLAVIRIVAALVRNVLPTGKLERSTEHFLSSILWLFYLSHLLGFNELLIVWMESISFAVGKTKLNLLMILSGIFWVAVIMFGAMWVSRTLDRRVMTLNHLDMSLRIVISKLARTLLMVGAVLIALPIVGIDLTVLSVFGGALGVGLGFGLQKIASNYVSGFIILLDRSVQVGDRVTIGDRTGNITQITARYVVIRSGDGTEALIPNENFIANTVVNQSYSDKSIWQSASVGVAYGTDLELALKILVEAAESVPRILKDPAPTAFVVGFLDSSINLTVGYWIGDPENGLMGPKSALNLAIWRAFEQHGVQIPFPQHEVRMLSPASPPPTHSEPHPLP